MPAERITLDLTPEPSLDRIVRIVVELEARAWGLGQAEARSLAGDVAESFKAMTARPRGEPVKKIRVRLEEGPGEILVRVFSRIGKVARVFRRRLRSARSPARRRKH